MIEGQGGCRAGLTRRCCLQLCVWGCRATLQLPWKHWGGRVSERDTRVVRCVAVLLALSEPLALSSTSRPVPRCCRARLPRAGMGGWFKSGWRNRMSLGGQGKSGRLGAPGAEYWRLLPETSASSKGLREAWRPPAGQPDPGLQLDRVEM